MWFCISGRFLIYVYNGSIKGVKVEKLNPKHQSQTVYAYFYKQETFNIHSCGRIFAIEID